MSWRPLAFLPPLLFIHADLRKLQMDLRVPQPNLSSATSAKQGTSTPKVELTCAIFPSLSKGKRTPGVNVIKLFSFVTDDEAN